MKSTNGPTDKAAGVVLLTKTAELLKARESLSQDRALGLVPTMGNLHEGHLALLKEALNHHQNVFFSIFVNPTQFGPSEDFDRYPRTLEEDLQKIEGLLKTFHDGGHRSVYVFAPQSVEEIYPPGFSTSISIGDLSRKFCGKFRPGHLDGVTTVVYQLFTLIAPHRAYFGKKDFQQTVVIKKMVHDLRMETEVVALPTVRDISGLALSSRNQYLSEKERKDALCLSQALKDVVEMIRQDGWAKAQEKVQQYATRILANPAWEYLEVCNADDLSAPGPQSRRLVVFGAVRIGKTRLIDNIEYELTVP